MGDPYFLTDPSFYEAVREVVTSQLAGGEIVEQAIQDAVADLGGAGLLTAKGDLLVHDGSGATTLAVGADGFVLTADASAPDGVKWAVLPPAVTDHGALTGLADDDHIQYLLVNADRSLNDGRINVNIRDFGGGFLTGTGFKIDPSFSNANGIRMELGAMNTGNFAQLRLDAIRKGAGSGSAEVVMTAGGATSTPSYAMIGDGGHIWSAGGAEAARILSTREFLVGRITLVSSLDIANFEKNQDTSTLVRVLNPNSGANTIAGYDIQAGTGAGLVQGQLGCADPQRGDDLKGAVFLTASGAGALSIFFRTNTAIPIIFGTDSTERARWLGNANTLQGKTGLKIEGGALTGNDLTLSSNALGDGKIRFGTSAYDEANDRLGIGTDAPNVTLDVRGAVGVIVGGFPSGVIHATSPLTAEFSNSVITGHSLFAGNTQLWYLGSVSGSNNNIAFINRQVGSVALQTSNSLVTLLTGSSNTLQGNAGMKLQGGSGIHTLTLSGGTGLASTLKLQEAITDIISAYGVAGQVQAAKVADPTGGATVDAESRTAINKIIDVLEGIGFSAAA